MKRTWMVRAGKGSYLFQRFLEGSFVALGWAGARDPAAYRVKTELADDILAACPEKRKNGASGAANKIWNFVDAMNVGDRVVSRDKGSDARFFCGEVVGTNEFHPELALASQDFELTNQRKVRWAHVVRHSKLSEAALKALRINSTIFELSEAVSDELWDDRLRSGIVRDKMEES